MSTEKKIKRINPKYEPPTPEKLRELSSLNLSDEQAEEVISSLTKYARALWEFTIQQEPLSECKNKTEIS